MCSRVSYKKINMKRKSFFSIRKSTEKGVGSFSHRYGSADPDPHQNVTDLKLNKKEGIPGGVLLLLHNI
jgi:hypothetical protein